MKQRVNLITLGVGDLQRSRRFYEALGWTTGAEAGDDVVFFPDGHPWEVAHNPRWTVTPDGGVDLSPPG